MPKEASLKDKLDGNVLDLSLSSLSAIPVNELALLPKATHLDLSCNVLTKLPDDFCSLQHIVHLDLSKNKIVELPRNFGELRKLQHLDLLGNEISTLPVSFCHLKNLKWLDLKDNPLKEPMKSIVGDCLDEKQCKACARNVLEFMKKVQAEQEKQFQKRLQEEREKEEQRKIEENKEKQRIKEERKREKDKRRREHEERLAQQKLQQREIEKETSEAIGTGAEEKSKVEKYRSTSGFSCCGVLLAVVIGIVAVIVGLYFYCSSHMEDKACHEIQTLLNVYFKEAHRLIETYTKNTKKQ